MGRIVWLAGLSALVMAFAGPCIQRSAGSPPAASQQDPAELPPGFFLDSPQTPPGTDQLPTSSVTYTDPNLIQIAGLIDKHALDEFTKLAARIRDWGEVVLDSPGGDVVAALAIGRLVRARSFETDVPKDYVCASACIFILAAGVDRAAYGKIGIHRPHYDDAYFAGLDPTEAQEKYDQLETITHSYLHDMGIPDELFTMMMRVPSDRIVWLSPVEIDKSGLDRIDPGYEEWLRAQYALRFGPNGYRRHLEGMELIGRCIGRGDQKCWENVEKLYPEALWDPRER